MKSHTFTPTTILANYRQWRLRRKSYNAAASFNRVHCLKGSQADQWMCPDCNTIHGTKGFDFIEGWYYPACCSAREGHRLFDELHATKGALTYKPGIDVCQSFAYLGLFLMLAGGGGLFFTPMSYLIACPLGMGMFLVAMNFARRRGRVDAIQLQTQVAKLGDVPH